MSVTTVVATIRGSGAGRPGVRIQAETRGFSVLQKSSPTLGPTQPPIQGISVLFSGGKAGTGEREGNHSSPSSVEVKNEWRPTSLLHIRLHGVEREIVTFAFKGTEDLVRHKLAYH